MTHNEVKSLIIAVEHVAIFAERFPFVVAEVSVEKNVAKGLVLGAKATVLRQVLIQAACSRRSIRVFRASEVALDSLLVLALLLSSAEGGSGPAVLLQWALAEAAVVLCRLEEGEVLGPRDDMELASLVHPQDPGLLGARLVCLEARLLLLGRAQLSEGYLVAGIETRVQLVVEVLARGKIGCVIVAREVESDA